MNEKVANFMKKTKRMGLLAAMVFPLLSCVGQPPQPPNAAPTGPGQPQPTAAVPANLSPGVAEVIRLAESGVGEDVILAYIQNSQAAFNLSADHVLYLRDLGLSSQMVTAMLNRDTALRNQSAQPASLL